jgi:hypothetical protein
MPEQSRTDEQSCVYYKKKGGVDWTCLFVAHDLGDFLTFDALSGEERVLYSETGLSAYKLAPTSFDRSQNIVSFHNYPEN